MVQENCIYLVMVTPEDNHNKYYRMLPNVPDSAHFTAEYGRVGATSMKKIYPNSAFDRIYRDKLSKGYVDQTAMHEDVVSITSDSDYLPITDYAVSILVDLLRRYADVAIKKNYTVTSKDVTTAMIDAATTELYRLGNAKSVKEFNDILLNLFLVIPRKMNKVSDYLASSTKDFSEILSREDSILDTMSGQVTQYTRHQVANRSRNEAKQTILEENGLEIRPCTDEEILQIKKFLGKESEDKLKHAYYVKNIETEKHFNSYCKSHGISRRDVKFLYHGSRNENWWNILLQGLILKPASTVVRTGSMFGHGLYFAPRAKKSIGYSSLHGSYWTGGAADKGFLAVYKVAYKNPHVVYDWKDSYSYFSAANMQQLGTDAVFASKEHGMLKNDEVIVYDEHQATIRYLIELE